MTINKSQGQTVQHVGLDLRSAVFTHGQFYVAVSRVKSVHNIKAIWTSTSEVAQTKNIVLADWLLVRAQLHTVTTLGTYGYEKKNLGVTTAGNSSLD